MSRTVKACQEIMKGLANANLTTHASLSQLTRVITVLRGGDPRTVANWMRVLEMLGYIKNERGVLWKLHFERCGEALRLLVKDGQKKLY